MKSKNVSDDAVTEFERSENASTSFRLKKIDSWEKVRFETTLYLEFWF